MDRAVILAKASIFVLMWRLLGTPNSYSGNAMEELDKIRQSREQLRERFKHVAVDTKSFPPTSTLLMPSRSTAAMSVVMSGAVEASDRAAAIPELRTTILKLIINVDTILPLDACSLFWKVKKILKLSQTWDDMCSVMEAVLKELSDQGFLEYVAGAQFWGPSVGAIIWTVSREKILITHPDIEKEESVEELTEPLVKVEEGAGPTKRRDAGGSNDLQDLLNAGSVRERLAKQQSREIGAVLQEQTVMEQQVSSKFKSKGGSILKEYCQHMTLTACREARAREAQLAREQGRPAQVPVCGHLHFKRILQPHTDERLGACSYLNACRHMKTCKFVHYEIDTKDDNYVSHMRAEREKQLAGQGAALSTSTAAGPGTTPQPPLPLTYAEMYHKQWINCDIRKFPWEVLGKFDVIMADPPWNIHMDLPYGTMSDEEMMAMNIQCLQTDGVLLIWVTGRAMELGRTCMDRWGYECIGEVLWVKTNQLQRLIRTGRTGHWLNHSKEHCLVGVKGNPRVNRNIDCDVIVAEVRETSRKPDEIYGILDRLSPGTKKLEIFGRPHNTRPGWVTLGNQVPGVRLRDPDILARFRQAFPDTVVDDSPFSTPARRGKRPIDHGHDLSESPHGSEATEGDAPDVPMHREVESFRGFRGRGRGRGRGGFRGRGRGRGRGAPS